jgi:hypothetical protein
VGAACKLPGPNSRMGRADKIVDCREGSIEQGFGKRSFDHQGFRGKLDLAVRCTKLMSRAS